MYRKEIENEYDKNTGISFKHQPLFVGDVYKNDLGTKGIVLKRDGKYIFKRVNGTEYKLPEERNGLHNTTFVANVIQDDELMKEFIALNIIKEGENDMAEENQTITEVIITPEKETEVIVEEPKPKKTTKKETKTEKPLNIYQKINLIRKAWAETDVEKEGKGRAGGGAKYDYYKPQQVIDFCLAQELKYNLYSRFEIEGGQCAYVLINLDNTDETEIVACPFDVPRKMAASEAQQVGAAITYYNRRLAMAMYKIEDNSKESVDVLGDADHVEKTIDIPAPPITNIQPEVSSKPVEESKISDDKIVAPVPEVPKMDNVVAENIPNVPTPPQPPVIEFPQPPVQDVPKPQTPSIESLY